MTRLDPSFQFENAAPLPVSFGTDGLIPAVIQEARTNAVLMVGFMNEEALRLTRTTGKVHLWSRSRGKLWRKGETSGHEQLVEEIYVNCELNSLLLTVRQVGAACHDGYPTCYYRRLEPDNRLRIVQERIFDPALVYGPSSAIDRAEDQADQLNSAARRLFGAYRFLRDNDLAEVSGTSARLRIDDDRVSARIGDELHELAGALDGSHRHHDVAADIRLEGGQVLYWTILVALRHGATWERLRPDRALLTADDGVSLAATVAMLRSEANRWQADPPPTTGVDVVAACRATLALVGQACRVADVPPLALIEADLAELRAKPYLAAYFAAESE